MIEAAVVVIAAAVTIISLITIVGFIAMLLHLRASPPASLDTTGDIVDHTEFRDIPGC